MSFYPPPAPVPETRRTARLFLRPLAAADAERDYDAVMSSAPELRRWSQSGWPAEDFTLAENRADLERHEREHRERVAFTYTVLDPPGARCLGCVYVQPPGAELASRCEGAARPATVGSWLRTSRLATYFDHHLLYGLRSWLGSEWAFDRVLFPVVRDESRQAELLRQAGLALAFDIGPSSDGSARRVFA